MDTAIKIVVLLNVIMVTVLVTASILTTLQDRFWRHKTELEGIVKDQDSYFAIKLYELEAQSAEASCSDTSHAYGVVVHWVCPVCYCGAHDYVEAKSEFKMLEAFNLKHSGTRDIKIGTATFYDKLVCRGCGCWLETRPKENSPEWPRDYPNS